MKIYDRLREGKGEGKVAAAGGPGTAGATNPMGSPFNPMMMPPWIYGQQSMGMPFPGYAGPGYQGYQQAPFPPMPNPLPAQPPADPLLSEWLKECETGARGADGHRFTDYLPALQASWLTRVSDIARLSSAKDLIDRTLDYPPEMPYGVASRLLDYAKSDYRKA